MPLECRELGRTSRLASPASPASYVGSVPRRPRLRLPGAVFHVTARGTRKQEIFRDEFNYNRFLTILAAVTERREWRCHLYCLLPNHYHLALEAADGDLSAGMHVLNGTYAKFFNRRYDSSGHLFQDRFHAVAVERTKHLLELARYLARNPVRAGLCTDPDEWRWSSFAAYAGKAPAPRFLSMSWVLEQFAHDAAAARGLFEAFVRDAPVGMSSGMSESDLAGCLAPVAPRRSE